MRYYISDLHFGHTAMNQSMDKRGFSSLEEMEDYMIEKWNKKVKKNDEVVVLGDLCMRNAEYTNHIIDRLKGRIFLITGNHDRRYLKGRGFRTEKLRLLGPYAELNDAGRKVILCHYPVMFYNGQYRLDENGNPKTYMLYGHVHDTQDQRFMEQFQDIIKHTTTVDAYGNPRVVPCNMINCFCMYSDFEPLTLDEWICLYDSKKKERQR